MKLEDRNMKLDGFRHPPSGGRGAVIKYLLEKEFKQFFRNAFLPKLLIVFPTMVMLILPWVTTMDIKHINIGIVDNDRSALSMRLIRKIEASDYFILRPISGDAYSLLASDIDVLLEIPSDFEKNFINNRPQTVSITANAVNANKGISGNAYLSQIIQSVLRTSLPFGEGRGGAVVNLYNPTGNYRHFMIPALMVMLIIILCGVLPALNIVSEKESGTIEQINVTPVGKFTFTLAKIIPYWLFGYFVLTVALVIARLLYGLGTGGLQGLLPLYATAMLFILCMTGFGLVVSNYSETMSQAMFVMFFFLLLLVLLSGLFTPIESMPVWAQHLTRIIPSRYFVESMRGIMLKGCGWSELWPNFVWLGGFVITLGTWAVGSYRKQS